MTGPHHLFTRKSLSKGHCDKVDELTEMAKLDCFNRIESLIEAGGANAVDEGRILLRQFEGRSHPVSAAIDDLLIEMMTLIFLVEAGLKAFQNSGRGLARRRLSRVKMLLLEGKS